MAAGDGLVTMTPTSIAYSGTSASINADGGVDFSAATSLSLNGVFTSSYDNYLIVVYADASATMSDIRLRTSGTDASGSNYTYQYVQASSTTVAGGRATATSVPIGNIRSGSIRTGISVHIYGPFLAQPTAMRSVPIDVASSATITDFACTHSLSTSYDGFSFIPGAGVNMTGNVVVFGYEE